MAKNFIGMKKLLTLALLTLLVACGPGILNKPYNKETVKDDLKVLVKEGHISELESKFFFISLLGVDDYEKLTYGQILEKIKERDRLAKEREQLAEDMKKQPEKVVNIRFSPKDTTVYITLKNNTKHRMGFYDLTWSAVDAKGDTLVSGSANSSMGIEIGKEQEHKLQLGTGFMAEMGKKLLTSKDSKLSVQFKTLIFTEPVKEAAAKK